MRIARLLFSAVFLSLVMAEAQTGVESTALGPLVKRANNHLSMKQFSDAVRSYSEAIGERVIAATCLRG
jgi:hypothetical protein